MENSMALLPTISELIFIILFVTTLCCCCNRKEKKHGRRKKLKCMCCSETFSDTSHLKKRSDTRY